ESVTTTAYDDGGNVLSVTDGRGKVTSYAYDALYRRTEVIEAFGDPELERTTTTTYDLADRVLTVATPRGTTAYTYDVLNRLLTTTEATGTPDQRTTTMAYDAADNLIRLVDPRGTVTSYAYNALNQRTQTVEAFGVAGVQRT